VRLSPRVIRTMVTFERPSCHALLSPNSTQFCTHRIARTFEPIVSLSLSSTLSLSLSLSHFSPLSLTRARVYSITIKYIHTHTPISHRWYARIVSRHNMLGIIMWCMTLSCRRCSTRVFKTSYETYLGAVGARSRLRQTRGRPDNLFKILYGRASLPH